MASPQREFWTNTSSTLKHSPSTAASTASLVSNGFDRLLSFEIVALIPLLRDNGTSFSSISIGPAVSSPGYPVVFKVKHNTLDSTKYNELFLWQFEQSSLTINLIKHIGIGLVINQVETKARGIRARAVDELRGPSRSKAP